MVEAGGVISTRSLSRHPPASPYGPSAWPRSNRPRASGGSRVVVRTVLTIPRVESSPLSGPYPLDEAQPAGRSSTPRLGGPVSGGRRLRPGSSPCRRSGVLPIGVTLAAGHLVREAGVYPAGARSFQRAISPCSDPPGSCWRMRPRLAFAELGGIPDAVPGTPADSHSTRAGSVLFTWTCRQ